MVELNSHGIDEATGILVPLGDARAMAKSIEHLLNDQALRDQLGKNAERDARQRFSLQRQVDEYLSWYGELIETAKGH